MQVTVSIIFAMLLVYSFLNFALFRLFIPYISYIISFVGVADIYIDVRKFIENRDGTNI